MRRRKKLEQSKLPKKRFSKNLGQVIHPCLPAMSSWEVTPRQTLSVCLTVHTHVLGLLFQPSCAVGLVLLHTEFVYAYDWEPGCLVVSICKHDESVILESCVNQKVPEQDRSRPSSDSLSNYVRCRNRPQPNIFSCMR